MCPRIRTSIRARRSRGGALCLRIRTSIRLSRTVSRFLGGGLCRPTRTLIPRTPLSCRTGRAGLRCTSFLRLGRLLATARIPLGRFLMSKRIRLCCGVGVAGFPSRRTGRRRVGGGGCLRRCPNRRTCGLVRTSSRPATAGATSAVLGSRLNGRSPGPRHRKTLRHRHRGTSPTRRDQTPANPRRSPGPTAVRKRRRRTSPRRRKPPSHRNPSLRKRRVTPSRDSVVNPCRRRRMPIPLSNRPDACRPCSTVSSGPRPRRSRLPTRNHPTAGTGPAGCGGASGRT